MTRSGANDWSCVAFFEVPRCLSAKQCCVWCDFTSLLVILVSLSKWTAFNRKFGFQERDEDVLSLMKQKLDARCWKFQHNDQWHGNTKSCIKLCLKPCLGWASLLFNFKLGRTCVQEPDGRSFVTPWKICFCSASEKLKAETHGKSAQTRRLRWMDAVRRLKNPLIQRGVFHCGAMLPLRCCSGFALGVVAKQLITRVQEEGNVIHSLLSSDLLCDLCEVTGVIKSQLEKDWEITRCLPALGWARQKNLLLSDLWGIS